MPSISISPLSTWARTLDLTLTPFMYLASGTFKEAPQRTHLWNNRRLSPQEIGELVPAMTVSTPGNPFACPAWEYCLPMMHLPILGGWRDYVVLAPAEAQTEAWYVGWHSGDTAGVSLLPCHWSVRVLEGPGPTTFFAVTKDGVQVPLRILGRGRIGDNGPYKHIDLR